MRQSYAVNGAQDRDTHQTRELSVYPHRQHGTTLDDTYRQEERIEYGSLLPSPMTNSVVTRARSEASVRAPWLVFWIAFAVRVVYLTLAHTYRVRPYDDHMLFGEEMGRIARALATGHGSQIALISLPVIPSLEAESRNAQSSAPCMSGVPPCSFCRTARSKKPVPTFSGPSART